LQSAPIGKATYHAPSLHREAPKRQVMTGYSGSHSMLSARAYRAIRTFRPRGFARDSYRA
jgi:hypothetical protein